ncbi:MAG: cyclic nucleotide-binding domain-containing protein [Candidatus Sedimenticola sp. 20ELBAFRAG]
MELDLNKFRTLIPINSLYEDNLLHLAKETSVERHLAGEILFDIGDEGPDSLFLISGEVLETTVENKQKKITADSDEAHYALANLRPRQYRAQVISDSATIARVDSKLLDKMLAWGQFAPSASTEGMEVAEFEGTGAEDGEWMMAMLQTSAFLKLPSANIQSLFDKMEEYPVKAGDVVIHQGDPGDYYYMIKEGRCKVTRPSESGTTVLAELDRCASFGEEALISDAPRNATITMITDGTLMRVSKSDFLKLLEEPLLNWIDLRQASQMVREGAVRLDVRLESEFKNSRIKGAVNIPLYLLRLRAPRLDRNKKYIIYCDTGQRSSAAAFLLSQRGYDVYVLKGGISALAHR